MTGNAAGAKMKSTGEEEANDCLSKGNGSRGRKKKMNNDQLKSEDGEDSQSENEKTNQRKMSSNNESMAEGEGVGQ